MRLLFSLIPAALLAACAYPEPKGGPPMPLVNAAGQSVGTVSAWQTAGGIGLRIQASGLPHGIHGIHVHAVGRCDGPKFDSAGPHWNPASRKHGLSNPAGPHGGDLPNVTVASNGVLSTIVTVPGASLTGPPGAPGMLVDGDGAALVIHAKADDNRTDPSGTSGDRIACAVLAPIPSGM
ncbi:MAG: superoxide dismutase family protein [Sphingomicrobium sp.]